MSLGRRQHAVVYTGYRPEFREVEWSICAGPPARTSHHGLRSGTYDCGLSPKWNLGGSPPHRYVAENRRVDQQRSSWSPRRPGHGAVKALGGLHRRVRASGEDPSSPQRACPARTPTRRITGSHKRPAVRDRLANHNKFFTQFTASTQGGRNFPLGSVRCFLLFKTQRTR